MRTLLGHSVTVARLLAPRQGETLAVFLERALEERGLAVNALARKLAELDGSSEKTWQRSLRRWTSGPTASISEENGAALAVALSADFTSFHRGGTVQVRNLLTQMLEQIEDLKDRVKALERP